MGVTFTRGSSTSLLETGSVPPTAGSGVPFTVHVLCRFRTSDVNIHDAWSLGDSATTSAYYSISKSTGDVLQFDAGDGGGNTAVALTSAWTVNTWISVIYRVISTTNRRCSAYNLNTGVFVAASSAVSRAPTPATWRFGLGAEVTSTIADFGDVDIAEVWWADADVGSATASNLTLAEHLAMMNPTNHQVFRKLRNYWSLRAGWEQKQEPDYIGMRGPVPGQWTPSATKPVGGIHPHWSPLIQPSRSLKGFVTAADILFAQSVM